MWMDGKLAGFQFEMIKRPIRNANIALLKHKLTQFHNKIKILVKRFPTNSLTIGIGSLFEMVWNDFIIMFGCYNHSYADLLVVDQIKPPYFNGWCL